MEALHAETSLSPQESITNDKTLKTKAVLAKRRFGLMVVQYHATHHREQLGKDDKKLT